MFYVLMKHEIKQTVKPLGIISVAFLLVVLTAAALIWLQVPILAEFSWVFGALAVFGLPWFYLGYLWVRYYQTLYGRVGYFTMSLPVRGRTILKVKVLWALVVSLAAYLIIPFVAAWLSALRTQRSTGEVLQSIIDFAGWRGLLIFAVLILFAVIATIAQGAFVITLGMQGRLGRLGLGGPAIVALVVYLVNQILVLVGMLFVPLGIDLNPASGGAIVAEGTWPSLLRALEGSEVPPVLGLGLFLSFILMAVVCLIWTARSIEQRTSLR